VNRTVPPEKTMPDPIESTSAIRRALGPIQGILHELSDVSGERRATLRLRKRLLHKYSHYCAACQTPFAISHEAEAAHILALEEGGTTTEDNLVLLCHGCHQLYDSGRAAVVEMRQAAEAWRASSCIPLRSEMENRNPGVLSQIFRPSEVESLANVYDLLQRRHPRKAIREVKFTRNRGLSKTDYAISAILEAQIERRSSAHDSLGRARRILLSMDAGDLPRECLPLYFYERGFICQMLGLHEESIQCFQKSDRAAADLNDRYSAFERIVAVLRIYAVETIMLPHKTVSPDALARRSEQFDTLAMEAARFDEPHAGRWIHNIIGWKWRYYLKCAEPEAALAVFNHYCDVRYRQNSTTGYTRDTGSRTCGFNAMMMLNGEISQEAVREVLRLACRSLVSLLSYRVRPEGIRDYLLTFESALRRLRGRTSLAHKDTMSRVTVVRESILDGSSFLDPYRASISRLTQ
jgi:HNH endonuclease